MLWLRTVFPFVPHYIWQQSEPFHLHDTQYGNEAGGGGGGIPCLYGRVPIGDNIMDEWFTVFLLAELSRKFADECFVRVFDNDGEFLLIEAAPDLPEWADPDVCENRVYLVGGKVHLVPHEQDSGMTVAKALALIRSRPQETLASVEVQQRVLRRLSCFPQDALVHNYHHCRLFLPAPLALALRSKPSLVAHAVRAFYYRDPSDTKHLQAMSRFDPTHHTGFYCRVRFTRCLYAQLLHQNFLPPNNKFSLPSTDDPLWKAASLGMKLTCGFELWCASEPDASQEVECATRESVAAFNPAGDFDDAENWMLVSPSEVEDLLAEREQEAHAQLNETVDLMREFMGHESTLDGAEIPPSHRNDDSSAEPFFNVSKFLNALQQGLQLEDMGGVAEAVQEEMDLDLKKRDGLQRDFDDEDGDVNFVTNLVKGLEAANGEPGPLSNLIRELKESN